MVEQNRARLDEINKRERRSYLKALFSPTDKPLTFHELTKRDEEEEEQKKTRDANDAQAKQMYDIIQAKRKAREAREAEEEAARQRIKRAREARLADINFSEQNPHAKYFNELKNSHSTSPLFEKDTGEFEHLKIVYTFIDVARLDNVSARGLTGANISNDSENPRDLDEIGNVRKILDAKFDEIGSRIRPGHERSTANFGYYNLDTPRLDPVGGPNRETAILLEVHVNPQQAVVADAQIWEDVWEHFSRTGSFSEEDITDIERYWASAMPLEEALQRGVFTFVKPEVILPINIPAEAIRIKLDTFKKTNKWAR